MPLVNFRQLTQGLVNSAANTPVGRGLVSGATNAINRAGEATYDTMYKMGVNEHAAIDAIKNFFGYGPKPEVDTWAQRGFPTYMRNSAPTDTRNISRGVLGGYAPNTLPQQIPTLQVYRADPTGRFGGKDGLETLPTSFDPQSSGAGWHSVPGQQKMVATAGNPVNMYAYARELGRSAKYGVPQLSAVELAALALKEGRDDFGANMYDHNNPQLQALAKRLYPQQADDALDWYAKHGSNAAGPTVYGAKLFPVAVADKMAVAKRLGIPFAEAWNGTGSNGRSTGADYARGYEHYLKAAANPKNKALVDFIQSALDAGQRDR